MPCLDVRDFPLPINSQSTHVPRLAGRSEDAIPEDSLRVDLLALRCREQYWYMGELVIPEPDDHVRPAAHSGVHRAVPQEQAESRVMRICRHAPDGIARIDELDACFRAGLFKGLDKVARGLGAEQVDLRIGYASPGDHHRNWRDWNHANAQSRRPHPPLAGHLARANDSKQKLDGRAAGELMC